MTVILKTYEEIDVLVDIDPLALRDYAVAVSAEVARLSERVEQLQGERPRRVVRPRPSYGPVIGDTFHD